MKKKSDDVRRATSEPEAHDVVFHVGVGKTATTTMQKAVFARSPNIHCIGRPNHRTARYERVYHDLTVAEPREVDWSFLEDFFSEALETARNRAQMVVLSDETLVASASYQQILAERLLRACPNSKIVLTIRSQLDLIPSFYKNHGRRVKAAPSTVSGRLIPFDDWFEFAISRPQDTYLKFLKYDQMSRCYEDVFGAENVHHVCYEALNAAPAEFGFQWGKLLRIDGAEILRLIEGKRENPSVSERRIAYDQIRDTRLGSLAAKLVPFRRQLGPLKDWIVSQGGEATVRLSSSQIHALSEMFASQNANLAARHGLELARFGYPLSEG